MPTRTDNIVLPFFNHQPRPAVPMHQVVAALSSGLRRAFGSMVRGIAEAPRRRAVLQELNMLSDRELADIGLARAELPLVFDPAFAARHAAERMRAG